jgi:hypothetical protein
MVSHNFAKKMIDLVQERRWHPKRAAAYPVWFCTCGTFNTTRVTRILGEGCIGT